MATVKVRTRGNTLQDIELENFATEETLLAVLNELKGASKSKGGSPSVVNDAKKNSEAIKQNTEHTLELSSSLAEGAVRMFGVTASLKVLEVAMSFTTHSVYGLMHTSGLLMATFAEGKNNLDDYVQAVVAGTKNIPVINEFTTLLGVASTAVMNVSKTLSTLDESGLSFDNSLIQLVANARQMGMSVEQYASLLKHNIGTLAAYGTVQDGQRKLTAVSTFTLENFNDRLSRAGITMDQYNEELPMIMSLFSGSMKTGGSSTRELSEASVSLMSEFQAMAELTGKSRKEQEEQVQRAAMDAAWQQKLNSSSAATQQKMNIALTDFTAQYGEQGAALTKAAATGMPLPKQLASLVATTPGLMESFQRLQRMANDSSVSQSQFTIAADETSKQILRSGVSMGAQLQTQLAAQSAGFTDQFGAQAEFVANVYKNNNGLIRNNKLDEAAYEKKQASARAQKKLDDDTQKSLLDFNNLVRKVNVHFTLDILAPLLQKMVPFMKAIAGAFEFMFTHPIATALAGLTGVGLSIYGLYTGIKLSRKLIEYEFERLIMAISRCATQLQAQAELGALGGASGEAGAIAGATKGVGEAAGVAGGVEVAEGVAGAGVAAESGGMLAGAAGALASNPIGWAIAAITAVGLGVEAWNTFSEHQAKERKQEAEKQKVQAEKRAETDKNLVNYFMEMNNHLGAIKSHVGDSADTLGKVNKSIKLAASQ